MRTDRNGLPRGGAEDEPGLDAELGGILAALDPAREDPHYWLRFRDWVLRNAAPELARRRLMSRLTVGEVLNSWARTVVPTAVAAAAVAAMILLRSPSTPAVERPLDVEELLVAGMEGATIPHTLGDEDDGEEHVGTQVAFAMEIF